MHDIRTIRADPAAFDAAACRTQAERFGTARFMARMDAIVADELDLRGAPRLRLAVGDAEPAALAG